MPGWIEKPSLKSDEVLDRAIEASQRFFKRHFPLLAKVGVPLLGFAIFLFYFHQHRFYPTFDLFQFSSLLLAASMIGLVVVGSSALMLLVAGGWLHYGFLETPSIKDDLGYIPTGSEQQRTRFALNLIILTYALPFGSTAVISAYVIFHHTSLLLPIFFLIPVATTLLSGVILQHAFELPRFSFLRFAGNAYFPTLLVTLLSSLTLLELAPRLDAIPSWELQMGAVYLIVLAISLIASVCSLGFVAGLSSAVHFCTASAVLIALLNGAVTTLPDKAINRLGLGNYQAEQIIFEESYCSQQTQEALSLNDSCVLNNVHVVWLMGDTLSYKTNRDSAQLIQIPARHVKAVIKAED